LVFGKYEVIRRLAIGGMGEVFLARQVGIPGFERLVILKSLLPELAEQQGFVDAFLDEARVAATLNHPNIVAIYEVGLWNGVYFIAMEHIHGVDLARLMTAALRAGDRIPLPVVACMVRDAALGLQHAHDAKDVQGRPLGIVHRDISPQNIMVRGDGVTKVVDFGIAKAGNRASRTRTGVVKGKVAYMPPEQLRGEDVDARADQFALGVVLWEMCTARRLFKANSDLELVEQILRNPIPPISQYVPHAPLDLVAVAERMLDRDVEARFASCGDVAAALRDYLETVSRQVGAPQVAECVQKIAGQELDARVKNISPTQPNFLISLKPGTGERSAVATPSTGGSFTGVAPRRSRAVLAGVFVLAAVLAGGGVLAAIRAARGGATGGQDASTVAARALSPSVQVRTSGDQLLVDVSLPVGASITVDGKAWPDRVPTTLKGLAPGVHALVLELDGLRAEQTVTVEAPAKPPLVVVKSDPPGAAVWLGNRPLGSTPLEVTTLAPDTEYDLQLSLRGYVTEVVKVKAGAGERVDRTVDLKRVAPSKGKGPSAPQPAPAAAVQGETPMGWFTVTTVPWARLFVDGQSLGSTPLFKVRLPAGTHTVKLVNAEQGVEVTKTIRIEKDKVLKEHWELK
jgi:serine/threonine-protein kinase